jgi:hypothetical protein
LGLASPWGKLPPANRHWLLVNALVATAAINVIVNASIAWLGVSGQDTVSMWGVPLVETSIFWNVIGTLFLLPAITCVLTTTAIRRDVRRGAVVPLDWLRPAHRRVAALPLPRWRRALVFGALSAVALAPPLVLVLLAAGVTDLTKDRFVICQTAFAVVLGILVTPPIALCAMADPHPLRHDPAP